MAEMPVTDTNDNTTQDEQGPKQLAHAPGQLPMDVCGGRSFAGIQFQKAPTRLQTKKPNQSKSQKNPA